MATSNIPPECLPENIDQQQRAQSEDIDQERERTQPGTGDHFKDLGQIVCVCDHGENDHKKTQ